MFQSTIFTQKKKILDLQSCLDLSYKDKESLKINFPFKTQLTHYANFFIKLIYFYNYKCQLQQNPELSSDTL